MEELHVGIEFTALDWVWTILFVLLMIVCGVIFYRLGKRSESDFFLAGRGLPWWLPATSVYATHTATDTPMWIGGAIYQWGIREFGFLSSLPGQQFPPLFQRGFSGGVSQ